MTNQHCQTVGNETTGRLVISTLRGFRGDTYISLSWQVYSGVSLLVSLLRCYLLTYLSDCVDEDGAGGKVHQPLILRVEVEGDYLKVLNRSCFQLKHKML